MDTIRLKLSKKYESGGGVCAFCRKTTDNKFYICGQLHYTPNMYSTEICTSVDVYNCPLLLGRIKEVTQDV